MMQFIGFSETNFMQMQLKYLAEEMQAVVKGLEKVGFELQASEIDGPISEVFLKVQHLSILHSNTHVICSKASKCLKKCVFPIKCC